MAKKRARISETTEVNPDLLRRVQTEEADDTAVSQPKKRKPRGVKSDTVRVRYDMPEGLRDVIKEKAYEMGIPANQLALYFLVYGLQELEDGHIDPTTLLVKSSSPKFRNNLDLEIPY